MPDRIAIARGFVEEGIGPADMAAFDRYLAPDVRVVTGLKPTGPIEGREEYKAIFAGFADAFPVSRLVVEDVFAEAGGDRVVLRFAATARHAKDYFGVAATGLEFTMVEVHTMRISDEGRIVENLVGAVNYPFEMIMAPVLAPMVLGALKR